jgi:hypothetical protein
MSNKLNFTRNISLEKEELIQFQNFLTDNSQKSLFEAITVAWGIVPQADLSGNDFLVEQGSLAETIQVSNDSVGIDSDLFLLSLKAFDNYPIVDDGNYYWLKVSHRYLNVEPGTVSVNTSGEVSGTGTAFTELLRNQTSGSPVKIKFYKEDISQNPEIINNTDVYEIVEVINDGSMILSGNFTAEADLNYIIIGSVSLGTTITTEQKEGIYSYNNCALELVAETVFDTPPTSGFTQGKDFYIARLRNSGGTVSIEDKRSGYYWTLDLGVTLPSKADRNANNITVADAALWLSKLLIYQNEYISLTSSGSVTIYDVQNTSGLISVGGTANTHSYTLRLPLIDNQNVGKDIFIKYSLDTSVRTGPSYFRVTDIDNNVLFQDDWTDIIVKKGSVIVKNNGTSWGILTVNNHSIASQNESRLGTSDSSVISPARLLDVFLNSLNVQSSTTRHGTARGSTDAETQAGSVTSRYVTPASLKNSKIIDRGDPVSADFSSGDFTLDGTWRNLDISSVVPSWASVVVFRVFCTPNSTAVGDGLRLLFRKDTNANDLNVSGFETRLDVAGLNRIFYTDLMVAIHSVGTIVEYNGTLYGNGIANLGLTVAFWL